MSVPSAAPAYDLAARTRRPRDRAERVRPRAGGRAARPRSRRACASSTTASTTSSSTRATRCASRSCSTRRGPGRTRTTRCSSPRSRSSAGERPELELVLTGGGHETLRLPPGVRSLGRVPERRARARSTAAPPRSSSRAATRASAGRCSRRWRAAAPSPRPPARRWRRSPAGPPSCSSRRRPRRAADAIRQALAEAPAPGRARDRAGPRVHVGAGGRGSTTRSTASSRRPEPSTRVASRVEQPSASPRPQPVLLARRRGDRAPADRALRGARRGVRRDRRHRPAARPRGRGPASRCGTASRSSASARPRSTAPRSALAGVELLHATSACAIVRALRTARPDIVLCMTDPPMVGDIGLCRRAAASARRSSSSARTSSRRSPSSCKRLREPAARRRCSAR